MGITEIAKKRIYDDLLMEEKYSTPDEILEYLRDKENFRSLSSLLKDTMIEAKVCDNTADDSVFISKLTDLLVDLEKSCGNEIKQDSKRREVSRWISGETKVIKKIDTAIKICFALGLDLDQSNTFLNKCGFCSLSVRKVEDSIYYYCLLSENEEGKKSFADAQELIKRYYNTKIDIDLSAVQENEKKSKSSTTIIMLDALKNTDWKTDDLFFDTFLIPNTKHFINFSKNALLEYYKVKNKLFITAIMYKVRNEEKSTIYDYDALSRQGEAPTLKEDEEDSSLHIQFSLRSTLKKFSEPKNNNEIIKTYQSDFKFSEIEKEILNKEESDPVSEKLCETYNSIRYKKIGGLSEYKQIYTETYQILLSLKKYIFDVDAIESQIILSHVLSDICSPTEIYKSALNALIGKDDNGIDLISLGTDGVVSGKLLSRKSFNKYESDPSIKTDRKSVDTNHKMIMMMYYLLFSMERYKNDYEIKTRNSRNDLLVFPDCTFTSFIDIVNNTLRQSCLPLIYLPNEFDCAIVMSIRKFETANNSNEYLNTPFDFFNELLRLILKDAGIATTDTRYWEKEKWDEDKE